MAKSGRWLSSVPPDSPRPCTHQAPAPPAHHLARRDLLLLQQMVLVCLERGAGAVELRPELRRTEVVNVQLKTKADLEVWTRERGHSAWNGHEVDDLVS